jgi:hypothetical protein
MIDVGLTVGCVMRIGLLTEDKHFYQGDTPSALDIFRRHARRVAAARAEIEHLKGRLAVETKLQPKSRNAAEQSFTVRVHRQQLTDAQDALKYVSQLS